MKPPKEAAHPTCQQGARENKTDTLRIASDLGPSTQLLLWLWLSGAYTRWWSRPEHRAMLIRMLLRVTGQEAHE